MNGIRRIGLALAALALPSAAPAQGVASGVLTLDEAYALAEAANPSVAAARAAATAFATREASAGLPPDPAVEIGAMNLALPGLSATMPSSMVPSLQVMQMVPFPGKLGLSERLAEQSTAMAEARARERWWMVRADVAMAYYEIYRTDRQIEVMERTLRLLGDLREIAGAMYASGSGRQADVLRASVEQARMEVELRRMAAMRTAAVGRLNALLGRPASEPVQGVALPPLPADLPDPAALAAWAESGRPMIDEMRTGLERAETMERLARRELWPDLTVGLQYGQRPSEMGREHMGGAMLGFTIPVFAGRRQLELRAEAAAMRAMAAAELGEARAAVDARVVELLADLERARALIDLYTREILPQAEAGVESALSSYRVGAVDFMTLLDARMIQNTYEQELHALVAEYGLGVAELETTVGRAFVASGPTTRMEGT